MRVLVISDRGKPVTEYDSVERTATEYGICNDTVREYINNGKLYKKGKVFFDWAMEGRNGQPA